MLPYHTIKVWYFRGSITDGSVFAMSYCQMQSVGWTHVLHADNEFIVIMGTKPFFQGTSTT